MSAPISYQARQLLESLQYISLSLKTVQGDVQLLAESIDTLNKSKIDLDDFKDDLFIEIQTAREAISKTLTAIDDLKGEGEGS